MWVALFCFCEVCWQTHGELELATDASMSAVYAAWTLLCSLLNADCASQAINCLLCLEHAMT